MKPHLKETNNWQMVIKMAVCVSNSCCLFINICKIFKLQATHVIQLPMVTAGCSHVAVLFKAAVILRKM